MTVIRHRKPDSIWLFDYTTLEGLSDCPDRVVCLSERSMNIIWQALVNVTRFRSRVFLEASGQMYTIVSDQQMEIFNGWVSDANVEMEAFPMCNDILQGMLNQLTILANKECCSGSTGGSSGTSGTGAVEQPPNGFNQNPGTPFPPDFANQSEYDSHKCMAAQKIVESLKADIANMALLTGIELGVSAITGSLLLVLVTPIPFDDLLLIATSLYVGAGTQAGLGDLYEYIDANEFELLCLLYRSSSASDAKVSLQDWFQDAIAGLGYDPVVEASIQTISDAMINYDVVNRLFINQPSFGTGSAGACSGCDAALPYWQFSSSSEGWVYVDGTDPNGQVSGSWQAGRLVTTIENETPYISKTGKWVIEFGASELTLPAGTELVIVARLDRPGCANDVTIGMFRTGAGGEDYEIFSPFTSEEFIELVVPVGGSGDVEYIYIQFGQASGCVTDGIYNLQVDVAFFRYQ